MRMAKGPRFTLIEILIVIAIIVILAAMLGGVLLTQLARAKNEAAANQIKVVLNALEQFKGDFGQYPSIDAGTTAGTTIGNVSSATLYWVTANSLGYRLCQKGSASGNDYGTTKVTTASVSRSKQKTWAGSYLTPESFPADQIVDNELKDLWGNTFAYCMVPDSYYTALKAGSVTVEPQSNGWATASANTFKSYNTADYLAYQKNKIYYARPAGNSVTAGSANNGFMGPVSYALNNTWIDSEVSMPEIWSRGVDGRYNKLQYNSSNTNFDEPYDKDNVGGNVNAMKIQ